MSDPRLVDMEPGGESTQYVGPRLLRIVHPIAVLNIDIQIWIHPNLHKNTRQADWATGWWATVYNSWESGRRTDSWSAPGGEPHTQSQLNSKGVEPDNESTASRDEYADAQRLGMGITKESEGKCKNISLWLNS